MLNIQIKTAAVGFWEPSWLGSDGKQAEQTVGTVLIPSACVSVWAVVRWMQSFHYHDYGMQQKEKSFLRAFEYFPEEAKKLHDIQEKMLSELVDKLYFPKLLLHIFNKFPTQLQTLH